ncbi:argonaute-like protein [Wolfiporia cocos MD-104 SS10]|uniref:Argonaute-like protein n=1 Tax=Wolfiporia cocos (strain MD-104) TaxID=742152 RepID=A0A2H3JKA1_WOLCO|nr:argonaute-like protein [Wolfiporia cocos MD-104 SS10]
MQIIDRLQTDIAPQVFMPRAVYDGRRNMFTAQKLPFINATFAVTLIDPTPLGQVGIGGGASDSAKEYRVHLMHVAEINPRHLHRFLQGQQEHTNKVHTAVTALSVVIRMEPSLRYLFGVRSFYTSHEIRHIGGGLVLWRGYFQSLRPAIGRMFFNIDSSAAAMYQPGPLIDLCLSFLGQSNPAVLAPTCGFPDRDRARLRRFLYGLRVIATPPRQQAGRRNTPRVIKKVSSVGANALSFTMREGGTITVARYFQQTYDYTLRFPDIVCVEVGNGALIPMELCTVEPGQIVKKQIPPERSYDLLQFAKQKPSDRIASITAGLEVLAYGQSEYTRQFGLHVAPGARPLSVPARILPPPTLKCGVGSRQSEIVPRNGAWNMVNRRFFRPCVITRWAVVIYEREGRFNQRTAHEMVNGLVSAARGTGIIVHERDPVIRWEDGRGRIAEQLKDASRACHQKNQSAGFPDLMVIILPEGGGDIYRAVKHFGDVAAGVATQRMKSSKCSHAKAQYFVNVCLKINVKCGGINTIPEPSPVALMDPHIHTIAMGAHVIRPPPGPEGRPSFTSLVGNVDSDLVKYVATSRVQKSRQEVIDDIKDMAKDVIEKYINHRTNVEKAASPKPACIVLYRAGVSEGQSKQVLDHELPRLKEACAELNMDPKITIVLINKGHHVRFFPQSQSDADSSGNCQAGTVIDRDVTHPWGLDWYLQSQAGTSGTSRPSHYSVLYDDNKFSADNLQALSYALCHACARSTRSISIPAPVYYAGIVASRAIYQCEPEAIYQDDPEADHDSADSASAFMRAYKPLHRNMSSVMYFS